MLNCINNSSTEYQKKQVSPPKFQDKSEKIINYFKKCSRTKIRVWDAILGVANFSIEIHPNQTTLSQVAGISRSYANRLLHEMSEESGLMEIINRGYKISCVYKITKWFFEIDVRSKLTEFFSAMKYIPVFGLLSLGKDGQFRKIKKCPFEYDTQLVKNNNKFIYKQHSQSTICKSDSKLDVENVVSYEKSMKNGNNMHVCNVGNSVRIIKDIKSKYIYNLSRSGGLKLICYPSKVLLLAIQDFKLANRKTIKNLWAYFKSRCDHHLEANGLQCDYKLMYDMAKQYNVDLSLPVLDETQLPPKNLAPERGMTVRIIPCTLTPAQMQRKQERKELVSRPGYSNEFTKYLPKQE